MPRFTSDAKAAPMQFRELFMLRPSRQKKHWCHIYMYIYMAMHTHGHNLFESSKLAVMRPIQHQTIMGPELLQQCLCFTFSLTDHVLPFFLWQHSWHIC